MRLILIRHGMTAGNTEHRYIGCRTDESLCPAGIALAKRQAEIFSDMRPDVIFVSPMKRCRETAAIFFPQRQYLEIPELKECDFGQFEGKNYLELSGDKVYQAWIDSGGTLPFPDGESQQTFQHRCCQAVQKAVTSYSFETAAVVAHSGTFMAVLSAMEESHTPYFDWKIPHCQPIFCAVTERMPLRLRLESEQACL